MRVLLGTKGLLKHCRCRLRLYSRNKTLLPSREICERVRKAIEARGRKLSQSARFRPGDDKKSPETPALEILCRALASSGTHTIAARSSVQSLSNKPPNIPLIPPENIKQEPEMKLTRASSGTPEIFNCKTCHENSSDADPDDTDGLMLVSCKNYKTEGSILKESLPQKEKIDKPPVKVDVSISPAPQANLSVKSNVSAPDENPEVKISTSKPQCPPKEAKSQSEEPQQNPSVKANVSAPEENPEVKVSISKPQAKPKEANCQCEEPQQNPSVKANVSAPEENPDKPPVKVDVSISPVPQAKLSVKANVSTPEENPEVNVNISKPQAQPKEANSQSEKPQQNPSVKANVSAPEENPDKPPVKVDVSISPVPQAKLSVKANVSAPEENPEVKVNTSKDQAKPKEANSQSEEPQQKTPSDSSSMASASAFPPGRNPCKDGPRGGSQSCEYEKTKPSPCPEEKKEIEARLSPKEEMDNSCNKPKPPVQEISQECVDLQNVKLKMDESMAKSEMKASQEVVLQPKEQEDAPSKPASPTESSEKWKQPPVPTSNFSFPLLAFPLGRNPCRDGPRGGGNVEKCKVEPKEESKQVCEEDCQKPQDEPKEKPIIEEPQIKETCPSWKEMSTKNLKKEDSCALKKPETKDNKTETKDNNILDTPKSEKPSPPCKKPETKDNKTETKDNNTLDTPKSEKPSPPCKKPETKDNKTETKDNNILDTPSPPCKEIKASTNRPAPRDSPSDSESEPKKSEQSTKVQKFPVAPLDRTLTAYLASIEPFLTECEFKEELKLTEEFEKNEGKELQDLLERAAANCNNWLTPRWTQAAYLAYQAPLTIFSSPGLCFPLQKFTNPLDCLTFTAKCIRAIYEFKDLVHQNKIPMGKMGNAELDNSQFSKIFGTVRRPGRFCDTIDQYKDSDYVVVVYKNNYFKLPIISSGKLLSVTSLMDELSAIVCCPLEQGEPFGLLTHDNRGNWDEARRRMCCQPGNADTLNTIDESLFVVCLDDCVPVSKGEDRIVQAYQLLHGGGLRQNSANRWMDKTIQLIVNPSGMAGFCYEHSPADCQPVAMLMDFVLDKVNECNGEESNEGEKTIRASCLKFQPISECVNLYLYAARRNIQKIANLLRMNVFQYECYGKSFIKAQGLNPDSYIQMALQLAYYNMYQTIPAQYESAHLRMFIEGRTEAIRSTSNESKNFVLAMHSETTPPAEQLKALQNAVDVHEELTKLALTGQGIDRHLFGLQQMALENGLRVPDFFKSKGYVRSVSNQLFTSHVATTRDSFMAHGPLICQGYGCCYNPREDKITFAISAWQTSYTINPELYGKSLKKCLDTMRRLILETGGDRVGENPCICENIST